MKICRAEIRPDKYVILPYIWYFIAYGSHSCFQTRNSGFFIYHSNTYRLRRADEVHIAVVHRLKWTHLVYNTNTRSDYGRSSFSEFVNGWSQSSGSFSELKFTRSLMNLGNIHTNNCFAHILYLFRKCERSTAYIRDEIRYFACEIQVL